MTIAIVVLIMAMLALGVAVWVAMGAGKAAGQGTGAALGEGLGSLFGGGSDSGGITTLFRTLQSRPGSGEVRYVDPSTLPPKADE